MLLPNTVPVPLTFVLIAGVIVFALALERFVLPRDAQGRSTMLRLKDSLGMGQMPLGFALLMSLFWLALFVFLFTGLILLLNDLLAIGVPTKEDETTNWRFLLTKVVALTGVLAATVALPFTLIRLNLLSRQTNAAEQGLLIDRLNTAQQALGEVIINDGLAMPNTSVRVGGILALSRIAQEFPDLRAQIIRMLGFHIRDQLKSGSSERQVGETLPSDVQTAIDEIDAICALHDPQGTFFQRLIVDIRLSDFSRFLISNSKFAYCRMNVASFRSAIIIQSRFKKCDLRGLYLEEAVVSETVFDRSLFRECTMDGKTRFKKCAFRHCGFQGMDVSVLGLSAEELASSFGDGSVVLPRGVPRPEKWVAKKLKDDEFKTAWLKFQHSIGQDPENPT